MAKKCIICDDGALFCVKGSSDLLYCKKCATGQFGNITYLISIEEQAKALKKFVNGEVNKNVNGGNADKEESDF